MNFRQKTRDCLANTGRELRNVFRTEESTQKDRNDLLAKIRQGKLAEELVGSEGWTELLKPEMDEIIRQASMDCRKHRSPHKDDKDNYYPSGVADGVEQLQRFLQDKIEQAQTARKRLSLLQKEERQDNV